jgi:membrane-bound ClpP family serine protease
MTEPIKKEDQSDPGSRLLPVIIKVVLGLVFLALGVWAIMRWFNSFKILFQGCVGVFLLLVGVIVLAFAKE